MIRTLTCLILLALFALRAHGVDRPNVVLIMVDDMGFSDLACYGGEVETPHLDKLAKNGLRFSQFYNTGRCWPSRASLMTGRYPHEVGHAMMQGNKAPSPAYRGIRKENGPFVSELLKRARYRTYHVGKWHLQTRGWPLDCGFDRSYCIKRQNNFFNPVEILDQGKSVKRPGKEDPDYYVTDKFNWTSLLYLWEHFEKSPDTPFFLYLAHTAPHFPLHAPAKTVAKYRKRYQVGWDEIRSRRLKKLQELGLIRKQEQLSTRDPDAVAWNSLSKEEQVEWAGRMAVHAAMIDHVDQGVGMIVDYLKKTRQFENTLILFLSDNGASAEFIVRGDGHDPKAPLGSGATYRCLEVGWANASNTPFRMHKIWNHEGGISTPLIAHWPARLGTLRPRRISPTLTHIIDLVPTILKAAGVPFPKKLSGRPLAPLFPGTASRSDSEALFWEHTGHRAIRMGDWKLVAERGKEWELYDMSRDRVEMNDLAKTHKDKLGELGKMWKAWADEVKVVLPKDPRKKASKAYREK